MTELSVFKTKQEVCFNEFDIFRFKISDRYSGLRGLKKRLWSIFQVERLALEFSMQAATTTVTGQNV
jgi:hypothetical protein